mmetsp:Transcript_24034/g.36071  ORF Transcript_24034/g.36071 Transcript_24034/m.36071 type:complete len:380 (-) Transcript_24034:945-2084(-)
MKFRSDAAKRRQQRRTYASCERFPFAISAMSILMIFALIGIISINNYGEDDFDSFVHHRDDSSGATVNEAVLGNTSTSIDEDEVGITSSSEKINHSTEAELPSQLPIHIEFGKSHKKDERSKVTQISLLGERNSGTNWMTEELTKCFPNLTVKPRLVRWKHWFQHDDGRNDRNTTLVVAQFRNPYDWTEAMRKVPHHSPLHVRLSWKDFVTKPWTMPRPLRDIQVKDKSGPMCYEKFHYHQLISCIRGHRNDTDYKPPSDGRGDFSGHQPIYELRDDGSGEPYASIVELRADKIRNFLNTIEFSWVKDLITVRYEDLLNNGTEALLKQIEHATGEKAACAPSPSQERRKRRIDLNFERWITKNTDWSAEELIGYAPEFR